MNDEDRQRISELEALVRKDIRTNGSRMARWAPVVVMMVLAVLAWATTFGRVSQTLYEHERRINVLEDDVQTQVERAESRINARLDRFEARITAEIRNLRRAPMTRP